jgi:hypothetical protein
MDTEGRYPVDLAARDYLRVFAQVLFENERGLADSFIVSRAGSLMAKGELLAACASVARMDASRCALLLGLLLGQVLDKEQGGLLLLASFPFFPDPVAIMREALV